MADLIICNKFGVILFLKHDKLKYAKILKIDLDLKNLRHFKQIWPGLSNKNALSFQNKDQTLKFLDISICLVLGNKMTPNLLHLIKLANYSVIRKLSKVLDEKRVLSRQRKVFSIVTQRSLKSI